MMSRKIFGGWKLGDEFLNELKVDDLPGALWNLSLHSFFKRGC
jgi:hypothetical protein